MRIVDRDERVLHRTSCGPHPGVPLPLPERRERSAEQAGDLLDRSMLEVGHGVRDVR
jgi:hypothetical protein